MYLNKSQVFLPLVKPVCSSNIGAVTRMGNEVKKRGGHRALAEKYLSEVEKAIEDKTATETWITDQLEEIQKQLGKITTYDEIIQEDCEEDKVEAELSESSKWSLRINSGIRKMKIFLVSDGS